MNNIARLLQSTTVRIALGVLAIYLAWRAGLIRTIGLEAKNFIVGVFTDLIDPFMPFMDVILLVGILLLIFWPRRGQNNRQ